MVSNGLRHAGPALAADVLPAAVAVCILVIGSQGAAANDHQMSRTTLDALAYGLLAGAGSAFLLRRRFPLVLLGFVVALGSTYLALGYPYGPVLLAIALAAFFMSRRHRPAVTTLTAALAASAVGAGAVVGTVRTEGTHLVPILSAAAQIGWVVIPAVVGGLIRSVRGARLHAEQEAQRREIEAERLRLAREVHDVVGHGLSLISLQAGVALHVLDRRPEQARVALEAIRRASTDALDELRATLALSRNGKESATRAPSSGLRRVPGLVSELRLAGLPVDVTVEQPTGEPLPPAVDQVAFRIVQEALTNVLRHSGTSRAVVRIQEEGDSLRIVVDDDGTANANLQTNVHAGHGLTGLRERTVELGGTFSAGPRAGGGWRVVALLPVTRTAPAQRFGAAL